VFQYLQVYLHELKTRKQRQQASLWFWTCHISILCQYFRKHQQAHL